MCNIMVITAMFLRFSASSLQVCAFLKVFQNLFKYENIYGKYVIIFSRLKITSQISIMYSQYFLQKYFLFVFNCTAPHNRSPLIPTPLLSKLQTGEIYQIFIAL